MDELKKQTFNLLEQYAVLLNLLCSSNCDINLCINTNNLFSVVLIFNHYTIISINYSLNNGFAIKTCNEKSRYFYMDLNQCKNFIDNNLTNIQNYVISKKH
jgi:hypothetical protein